MSYYVYLIKCSDGTLYCGYTNNLAKRIEDHNSTNKGAKYTKNRRPVELVYFENYFTLSEALKREYYIKRLPRNEKDKLIEAKSIQSR